MSAADSNSVASSDNVATSAPATSSSGLSPSSASTSSTSSSVDTDAASTTSFLLPHVCPALVALHLSASRGNRWRGHGAADTPRSTLHAMVDVGASPASSGGSHARIHVDSDGSPRDDTREGTRGMPEDSGAAAVVVTGLSMLASARTCRQADEQLAFSPSSSFASWPLASAQRNSCGRVDVRTPFVSVEGVRPTHARGVGLPASAPRGVASSAPWWMPHVATRVAAELLCSLGTHDEHARRKAHARPRCAANSLEYAEVVTAAMGAASTGKTALLLGSLCDPSDPDATGGGAGGGANLLSAVVHRIFELAASPPSSRGRTTKTAAAAAAPPAPALSPPVCEVAVSLLEVRDAEPFSHVSALERSTEAVDLLSGSARVDTFCPPPPRHHGDRHPHAGRSSSPSLSPVSLPQHAPGSLIATGCFMKNPSDIPAARYVYCTSAAEVDAVVACGLSRARESWHPQRTRDRGEGRRRQRRGRPQGHPAERGDASEAASSRPRNPYRGASTERVGDGPQLACAEGDAFFRPRGSSGVEMQGHLLLTLVVCAAATHQRVGVWKLWDLAGPRPSHMQHEDEDEDEDEDGGDADEQRRRGSGEGARLSRVAVTGFAERAHAGLVSLLAAPTPRQHAARAREAAACDPVCRLLRGSLTETATLFTLLGVVRPDGALERINEDVLRSCQTCVSEEGAAAAAAAPPPSEASGHAVGTQERVWKSGPDARRKRAAQRANAAAALRVLERFAIDAEAFLGYRVCSPPSREAAAPFSLNNEQQQPEQQRSLVLPTHQREGGGGVDAAPAARSAAEDKDRGATPVDALSINVTTIAPDDGDDELEGRTAHDEFSGLSLLREESLPTRHTPAAAAAVVAEPVAVRSAGHSPHTPPSISGTQRPSIAEKKRSLQRLQPGAAELAASVKAGNGEADRSGAADDSTLTGVELFPARAGVPAAAAGADVGLSTEMPLMWRLQERFLHLLREKHGATPPGRSSPLPPRRRSHGQPEEEPLLAQLAAVVRSNADALEALTPVLAAAVAGDGDDDGEDTEEGHRSVKDAAVVQTTVAALSQHNARLREELARSTRKVLWLEERLIDMERGRPSAREASCSVTHASVPLRPSGICADAEEGADEEGTERVSVRARVAAAAFSAVVQSLVTDWELLREENGRLRRERAAVRSTKRASAEATPHHLHPHDSAWGGEGGRGETEEGAGEHSARTTTPTALRVSPVRRGSTVSTSKGAGGSAALSPSPSLSLSIRDDRKSSRNAIPGVVRHHTSPTSPAASSARSLPSPHGFGAVIHDPYDSDSRADASVVPALHARQAGGAEGPRTEEERLAKLLARALRTATAGVTAIITSPTSAAVDVSTSGCLPQQQDSSASRGTAAATAPTTKRVLQNRNSGRHDARGGTLSLDVVSAPSSSASSTADRSSLSLHPLPMTATTTETTTVGATGRGVVSAAAPSPALASFPASLSLREAAVRVQNCALMRRQQQQHGAGGRGTRHDHNCHRLPLQEEEVHSDALFDAIGALQGATRAVEAELREAAEREREYLNMIL